MALASMAVAGREAFFCCCQYCITMAMVAAPQPFFSCFTKGTSSHTPDCPAASSDSISNRVVRLSAAAIIGPGVLRSVHRDDDQYQHRDCQNNQDQVAVAETSGCKIRLRFVGAGR